VLKNASLASPLRLALLLACAVLLSGVFPGVQGLAGQTSGDAAGRGGAAAGLTSGRKDAAAAGEKIIVAATIPPLADMVGQIGRELVEVLTLVPAGADVHTYEPRPRQMAGLSRAALLFATATEFDRAWAPRLAAANPGLRVVDLAAGLDTISMAGHGHEEAPGHDHAGDPEHGHEAEQEHAHEAGAADPHVWLSPRRVMAMAGAIRDALAALDPAHAREYTANAAAFTTEAQALDTELASLFAGLRGRRFLVFHPSWGYLAADYGLIQVAVEQGGREPSPRELARIIDQARSLGIGTVFVQPQISARAARALADALGADVVMADPLARDWAANLRQVAGELAKALKN